MDKKVGVRGLSRITLKNVLPHSAEKIVQESFSVSFNFGYRKNLGIRGVGHEFLLVFCLTLPINFIGAPFCVSQFFWF